MGRDAMKSSENPCFRCRKEAAKYNEKLYSREGAAEMLGVSVSSLADYELGVTKVIPVDKLVLMADLYNAPELKVWYCSSECPIGRDYPLPDSEPSSVESVALRLVKELRDKNVERIRDTIIDVLSDGKIDDKEAPELEDILSYVDSLIQAACELKMIGSKLLGRGKNDD